MFSYTQKSILVYLTFHKLTAIDQMSNQNYVPN